MEIICHDCRLGAVVGLGPEDTSCRSCGAVLDSVPNRGGVQFHACQDEIFVSSGPAAMPYAGEIVRYTDPQWRSATFDETRDIPN